MVERALAAPTTMNEANSRYMISSLIPGAMSNNRPNKTTTRLTSPGGAAAASNKSVTLATSVTTVEDHSMNNELHV